jgi:protein-tyrosine phosphatase
LSLYWIDNANSLRLAIASRPRGGDWLGDEIRRFQNSGVHTLVSLLTSVEISELELEKEQTDCLLCGIEYLNFPIEDRAVPTNPVEYTKFVGQVAMQLKEGKSVAVHCRAGIGRSSLLASSLLIVLGIPLEQAWLLVQNARGCAVPDTAEQREFVERFRRGLKVQTSTVALDGRNRETL